MDEVQKSEMSGGASKGIVIASLLIGYFGIWVANDTLTTFTFVVGGLICSLFVMFVLFMVYGGVLANNDKEAQNQRVAQAATEYLRDKERAGK